MADGDQILIQTIKNLAGADGDDEAEDYESLADFSTEFVLESAARCLNAILPSEERPFSSVKPPPSMAARFKMGSRLAEICLQLGYTSKDLGYQTFLYANESEIRSIFMFLIDKLPKEKEDASDVNVAMTKKDEVKMQVASSIRSPNSDRKSQVKESKPFSAWDLEFLTDEELFRLLPRETRAAAIDAKIKINSLIQKNEEQKLENSDVNASNSSISEPVVVEELVESKEEVLVDSESAGVAVPALAEDESDAADAQVEDVDNHNGDVVSKTKPALPSQDQKLEALRTKKAMLEEELKELQGVYKSERNSLIESKRGMAEDRDKMADLQTVLANKKQMLEKRKQVLTLLPDGLENVQKLKGIIAKKKSKILALQEQFEEHKTSLLQENQELSNRLAILKDQQGVRQPSVISIKDQIVQLEQDLAKQEAAKLRLAKQLEAAKAAAAPRSAYTKQIIEILNNVSKQKKETEAVIEDIKSTQKDINLLEGKLQRTYMDADYLLFEQAKKDRNLVPAYRLLTEIHLRSDEIIEIVRKTGQLKRATRSLNDQANAERAKKVEEKVRKLQSDLDQLRAESK